MSDITKCTVQPPDKDSPSTTVRREPAIRKKEKLNCIISHSLREISQGKCFWRLKRPFCWDILHYNSSSEPSLKVPPSGTCSRCSLSRPPIGWSRLLTDLIGWQAGWPRPLTEARNSLQETGCEVWGPAGGEREAGVSVSGVTNCLSV